MLQDEWYEWSHDGSQSGSQLPGPSEFANLYNLPLYSKTVIVNSKQSKFYVKCGLASGTSDYSGGLQCVSAWGKWHFVVGQRRSTYDDLNAVQPGGYVEEGRGSV